MYTMREPDCTQEDIQSMLQIVIWGLDGAVTGIFTAKQAQNIGVDNMRYCKIEIRTDLADYINSLGPDLVGIVIGCQLLDLGVSGDISHGNERKDLVSAATNMNH